MKLARHAGLALSIGGFLLIGYSVYDVVGGRIYQSWRGRELDRTLESLPVQPTPPRSVTYEPGSAIGRLEIPRIGLSVVVLEGSDAGTLRLGVGRVPNSGLPGVPGNVVLAGHRDTFFRALREIRPGDEISLRTPQGTFPYTVDWTTVVNPRDTSLIAATKSPALTLVTCYPFYYIGPAPQRFIVRALPLGTSTQARRPSPFGSVAASSRRPAVSANLAPVTVAPASPIVTAVAASVPSAATAAVEPIAAHLPTVETTPAQPIALPAVAGDPPVAADAPATPRKGPLKRAFHKIAGVFSGGAR